MRKSFKLILSIFIIFILNFTTIYGYTFTPKAVAVNNLITSSSKKFQYNKSFTAVNYNKQNYKLPSQLHLLPKKIQKDIKNEFVKIKTVELKIESYPIASEAAFGEVTDRLNILIDDNLKLQIDKVLTKCMEETTNIDVKSYLSSSTATIKAYLQPTIKDKALRILKDKSDALQSQIVTEASDKTIKQFVEKSSNSSMQISIIAFDKAIKQATVKTADLLIKEHFAPVIKASIASITPDEVTRLIVAWQQSKDAKAMKPVIYLYPTEKQTINVKLDPKIELSSVYPKYDANGWSVLATPDGTLLDEKTGRQYYCLYWEGITGNNYDLTTGFVVKGEDTSSFLETYLKKSGLSEREANEFIIYWLPKMEANKYNLIHFATDEYNTQTPIEIIPKPDSLIRVLMVYKPLDKPTEVTPQEIATPTRSGFTVVEWGGSEIK